jgi:hypothetical protein
VDAGSLTLTARWSKTLPSYEEDGQKYGMFISGYPEDKKVEVTLRKNGEDVVHTYFSLPSGKFEESSEYKEVLQNFKDKNDLNFLVTTLYQRWKYSDYKCALK